MDFFMIVLWTSRDERELTWKWKRKWNWFPLNQDSALNTAKPLQQTMAALNHVLALLIINLAISSQYLLASKHGHGAASHHRSSSSHSHSHHGANPRLRQAYLALQAWKRAIFSDLRNFTSNWSGPSVCNYTGVFCTHSTDDPATFVVAGIDLNHANIAGFLPEELGLLTDLALLHLNSNRFCGIIPTSLSNLSLLFELDISNNRFVGPFPSVVLSLPSLHYLDIRFNEFEGPIPSELFNIGLDAIFINNNWFNNVILPMSPSTITKGSPSVIVLANNNISGCLPPSIANFASSLEELLLINTSLSGCLPPEVGFLYNLRVLDVSYNMIEGPIPYSLAGLAHLEQLNLGHNMMSGIVPSGICELPSLKNFTYSYNFFCEEVGICSNLTGRGVIYDDRQNCLPERRLQRTKKECQAVEEHPIDCFQHPCHGGSFSGFFGGGASTPAVTTVAASPLLSPSPSPSGHS